MSSQTDQRKQVRIITYNAALVGLVKSVVIKTAQAVNRSPIYKECVQVLSAAYLLNPGGDIPVYMDDTANPTGLPVIYISGYSAPS